MKIVLFALNGSYAHTNLAVRCLREPLLRCGLEVSIVEKNLRDRRDDVLFELYNVHADVYGFSSYIWNICDMLQIAENLKKLLPSSVIVFGGPEVSFDTERFEKCDFIDYIICGEGEISFTELCLELSKNEKTGERIIYGTPYKDMINEGIFYDRDDLCIDGAMLYYESSRGCPYNCSYCLSSSIHGVTAKSVEKTLSDLDAFEKLNYNFNIIKFIDRTFNFDIKRANKIWGALKAEKYTKKYHFEICASLLNEESFEILASLPKGKIQLEIGLQSTNLPTLAEVSRHISPDSVIENIKRIYNMGNIHVHADLIAGLPYESYERFAESFDAIYGKCDMLQLGFLKLLHGTKLRTDAQKYGYQYQTEPPYTVLVSDYISYDEIHRLEEIAALLKRYYESGKFAKSLEYIMSKVKSPFRFYEGLSEYIKEKDGRHITGIGQPEAYKFLLDYALAQLPDDSADKLYECIDTDFISSEKRRLPITLKKGNLII